MEISAQFNFNRLDHTKINEPHLVVSLSAPALDWIAKRPSLCVVAALDLSGSMAGSKLDYAKKSLTKLVEHLQPGDVIGLVTFARSGKVLLAPQPVTADLKNILRGQIDNRKANGGTNLADGLFMALDAVNNLDLGTSFLKRVIVFTDGQPNEGLVDREQIRRVMVGRKGSITVSSFGYGSPSNTAIDAACDQNFLTQLSQDGGGNYAYIQNPDDSLSAFGQELGGLLSTYATNLNVVITPSNGHRVTETVTTGITPQEDVIGVLEIPITDILSEEKRHLVFKTKLLEQGNAFPRGSSIFDCKVTYSVMVEDGTKQLRAAAAKAKVTFVKPDEAQTTPDKAVDEIVTLHRMVKVQMEAEEQAKKGHYSEAVKSLENFAVQAQNMGYTAISDTARHTRQRVNSRESLNRSGGYLRSMQLGVTRSYGLVASDQEASELLTSCSVDMTNTSRRDMATSFRDEEPLEAPEVAPEPSWVTTPVDPSWVIPSSLGTGADEVVPVDSSSNVGVKP